ncbi:MAG: SAM-dependent methyltransferase [Jatrophihabitans sp.]|uniref:SAM-dependent methyltransferase n=1 Tax=Jatrophihabitans sp. TaxID=1932789 RepID=UPI003F7E1CC5
MTTTVDEGLQRLMGAAAQWEQGAWCLAALRLSGRPPGDPLGAAALTVLDAVGLTGAVDGGSFTRPQLDGLAAAPLLQTATLVSGEYRGWSDHTDEAILAQGQASGSAAAMFRQFMLPQYPDLAARLAAPGARMIDVGTGVGALAVGYAVAFPNLEVTGIDVFDRALAMAEQTVREAGVADRVQLRRQDVTELTEVAAYDLAWIPAPFVPEPAFGAGVARLVEALRPGGLLIVGHGKYDGSDLDNALTRFKTLAYGGTPLDSSTAVDLLTSHGLRDVLTVPTPPGAPGLTVGTR